MEVWHYHNGDNGGNTDTALNIGNSLLGHTHTPSVLTPVANLGIPKATLIFQNSLRLLPSSLSQVKPAQGRAGWARPGGSPKSCLLSSADGAPLGLRVSSLALLPRMCIGVPYLLPVRPTPVLQTFQGPAAYVGSKPIVTLLIYPVWPLSLNEDPPLGQCFLERGQSPDPPLYRLEFFTCMWISSTPSLH